MPDRTALSPFTLNPSRFRHRFALTLVELLVVIIILTTLVGGVIPVLSPNNDSRKIRAASRGLQGYISQIQAKAARTGRPHGIGFQESSVESGVAIEVFGLEVPPTFAGFSTSSHARIMREYNSTTNTQVFYVQFLLADAPLFGAAFTPPDEYVLDPIPPNFLRPFDVIEIDGVRYQFIDSAGGGPKLNAQTGYYISDSKLQVVRLDEQDQSIASQTFPFVKGYPVDSSLAVHQHPNQLTSPKPYKIIRQPTNSSEEPYQLPASIAIDMQGSVTEGSFDAIRWPLDTSLYTDRSALAPEDREADSVGIMFSPNGVVSSVIMNGVELPDISRIVLLLGRIENGGFNPTSLNLNASDAAPWTLQNGEELEDVQERVNWLNLESRLLSIVPSNGRVVVSEPAFVDITSPLNEGGNDGETAALQIEAAHEFVHDMSTVGGN